MTDEPTVADVSSVAPTPTDTGVRPEDGPQPTPEEADALLAALLEADDE